MGENGHATTAEEYRQILEKRRGEFIPMPSGAVFRILMPTAYWWLAETDTLPVGESREGQAEQAEDVGISIREFAKVQFKLITERIIEPKIRHPADKAAGEIDPSELDPEDAKFLMDLLNGRIDKSGRSLREDTEVPMVASPGAGGSQARQVGDGVIGDGDSGITLEPVSANSGR